MLSGHFIDDERLKLGLNFNTKLLEVTTRSPYVGRLLALPVMLIDFATLPVLRIAAIIENLARAIINLIGAAFKRQDCSVRQALNHFGNVFIHLLAIPIAVGQAVGSFFIMIVNPKTQLQSRLELSNQWTQIRIEINAFVTSHDVLKRPESKEMAYAAFTHSCEDKLVKAKAVQDAKDGLDDVSIEKNLEDWEALEEVKYRTLFEFAKACDVQKDSKPLQDLAKCGELLETLNNCRTSLF